MQWFRMYTEFSTDPKVQMLSEVMQRRLVMVFCMRASNSLVTLHETEIAFQLRISDDELKETKRSFVSKGFIDESWNVLNWDMAIPLRLKHRAGFKASREKRKESNGDVTLQKRRSNALEQNRTEQITTSSNDDLFNKFCKRIHATLPNKTHVRHGTS